MVSFQLIIIILVVLDGIGFFVLQDIFGVAVFAIVLNLESS